MFPLFHKNILFVDVEHTFDEEWAATLGVNPEEVLVLSPESEGAETVFDIILDSIRTDLFGLIIIAFFVITSVLLGLGNTIRFSSKIPVIVRL